MVDSLRKARLKLSPKGKAAGEYDVASDFGCEVRADLAAGGDGKCQRGKKEKGARDPGWCPGRGLVRAFGRH